MNTTENNKLIAEFMGRKYRFQGLGIVETSPLLEDVYKQGGSFIFLDYHSDWNRLMEVCNKATTLDKWTDYPNQSQFWDTFCQVDSEEVCLEIVAFLQWYNQEQLKVHE